VVPTGRQVATNELRGTSALKKESRQVLTLTKQGQRLIRQHGFVPEDQAIYSGFVKPKEANHDADLYRLYNKAAEEIERNGGKIVGVRLDYELKEKLYQRLGRAQARRQGEDNIEKEEQKEMGGGTSLEGQTLGCRDVD
jgi:hypothetical protein